MDAPLQGHLHKLRRFGVEVPGLAKAQDRFGIAKRQSVQRLLVVTARFAMVEVMGKVRGLDDQRLGIDKWRQRIHQREPVLAFRINTQGDRHHLCLREELCDERKHRVNSVLLCEESRIRGLRTGREKRGDSGFVACDIAEDCLEGSSRRRKRQPRAPEMIRRKQNDPLVIAARSTAKAASDQVCCHKVMGHGDSGHAMSSGRRDRFLCERMFKDRRVVVHRREPRRRPNGTAAVNSTASNSVTSPTRKRFTV